MQPLFSPNLRNGYVADLMKQYGDRGRPMPLPKIDEDQYRRGMEFREQEKAHYRSLETRLKEAESLLEQARGRNRKLTTFVNSLEFLDKRSGDAGRGGGGDSSDVRGDSGRGVLPPSDHPSAVDTHDGTSAAIISSTEATDEPPNARATRPRRNNAKLPRSGEDAAASDAGGSLALATDGTEPDVGRPSGEHDTEE